VSLENLTNPTSVELFEAIGGSVGGFYALLLDAVLFPTGTLKG
jgi:hypothetical protein